MAIIENIRLLKGAAVLAERKAATPSLDLKRFNLFYGFNGSGKSTLSRIFAALQHGKKQERLPEGCTFEIEMSNAAKFSYPKAPAGLEKCVCVFNGDFIAENLRWETGVANPVFYIGADQADVADQLKALENILPATRTKHEVEARCLMNARRRSPSTTERFADGILAPSARGTARLDSIVHHLGLALGGRPAAGFARRLMLPVSKDTLLRVVRRRSRSPGDPLKVIGIDDWAWRRNHRYASIICNLERRRVVTLLPDREPATAQA